MESKYPEEGWYVHIYIYIYDKVVTNLYQNIRNIDKEINCHLSLFYIYFLFHNTNSLKHMGNACYVLLVGCIEHMIIYSKSLYLPLRVILKNFLFAFNPFKYTSISSINYPMISIK